MLVCSAREEEAIQLDGLSAAQIKELREKSEKHAFQAEVNRMMKLIINSLYKNKEVSGDGRLIWCWRMTSLCVHQRGWTIWAEKPFSHFRVVDQPVKYGSVTWMTARDDQVAALNASACEKRNLPLRK